MTVIAIDIGGSGSRISATDGWEGAATGPALTVVAGRADHPEVVGALARELGSVGGRVTAVAVGAAGLMALGDADSIVAVATALWPGAAVVVASDGVTAVVGAWGIAGGGVVAAGTGVVAFATDLDNRWIRSDGWGHELGDDGGAAWIGRRGLAAGLRALDGRPGGSERLLTAVREHYGDPLALPWLLRSAANAATFLAGFAPAVTEAAGAGDPSAREIVDAAAHELAETGLSVLADGIPPRLALVGGLAADPVLTAAFAARVRESHPDLEVGIGTGTPLDGARDLARLAAEGHTLRARPPYLIVASPSTSTPI